MLIRSAAILFFLSAAPQAFAGESVYTDVDLDHCKTLSEPGPDDPGDYVSLQCKGYKDFPLYFKEGDLRQSVHFGHLDQEIIDYASESFGAFNHIGKKVEWRLDANGEPYAAILRQFIENSNPDTGMPEKALQGQVLVISRVGRPDDKRGCVVGYIDALKNAEPNELARKVADEVAPGFACGKDRPAFHGERSASANDPSYNFPGATDQ
jgi:hypothetical protein